MSYNPNAGGSGGTDLAFTQATRSTTYAVTGTAQFLDFTGVDDQNDTNVVEWDIANPERITVKETGLFMLSISLIVNNSSGSNQIFEIQLHLNGVQVVPATLDVEIGKSAGSPLTRVRPIILNANDYVSVKVLQTTGGGNDLTIEVNTKFFIMREKG